MNIVPQVIAFVGIALIGYAIYGIFSSADSKDRGKRRTAPASRGSAQEEKIQRLEEQIKSLENDLEISKSEYTKTQNELAIVKARESQLQQDLTKRQDWVAKSEEILNKIKQENVDLKNKFIAKDKESEEAFAKNVNLTREIRELNERSASLEKEIKEKSSQIEAQKHQIERYTTELKTHLATIAEFKNKEQISEWVPKLEFNKLNEEYTALEKELEEKDQRLNNFAQVIAELKSQLGKNEKQKE